MSQAVTQRSRSGRRKADENGQSNHAYRGVNLFDDKNYQALLDRLNNGFPATKDIIRSMKKYLKLREGEANRLTKYSRESISTSNGLSPLSHYGTTAAAVRRTYTHFEEQAEEIRNSCEAIRTAINWFKQQLDGIYPKQRLRIGRRHRHAKDIERRFISAHTTKTKALNQLPKSTIEKQNNPQNIQEDTPEVAARRQAATTVYNAEVQRIFNECQTAEQQRLDLIRNGLLKFIEAIHPSNYHDPLVQKFRELKSHIEEQQKSLEDTNEWGKILGIEIPTL